VERRKKKERLGEKARETSQSEESEGGERKMNPRVPVEKQKTLTVKREEKSQLRLRGEGD